MLYFRTSLFLRGQDHVTLFTNIPYPGAYTEYIYEMRNKIDRGVKWYSYKYGWDQDSNLKRFEHA